MFVTDFLKNTLKKLAFILDDQNNPLLGPNLRLLKFAGVWQPVKNRRPGFARILVYITLGFFFSQYIKLSLKCTLDKIRLIIQFVPFHTGLLKAILFVKDHEKWSELIAYISSVEREELSKNEPKIKRIVEDYMTYSHRLTYFFWIMAILSNLGIFADLYQKVYDQQNMNITDEYINIFDAYTPWSREPPGYFYSLATQIFFANVVTLYVMSWDPSVAAAMIFFAGQLKISSIYCEIAIDSENKEECHQNIEKCHRFHTKLVRYQETFNSLISPAMFVYLIVTSVNLGVCIIEMVELQDNPAALLSYCVYVLACMIQLLLFYWHSNEVTEESILVSYGTFRSNWVVSSLQLQKKVAILAHTTNKRLVFQAGPFNEMSLATFVSILRGSYSFYTLMNETN